jgi:PKHD-type hydroxylase
MILGIPPRLTRGQDDLAFWDGFLTEAEINFLLARPEWLQTQPGCVRVAENEAALQTSVRETNVAWLGAQPELHQIWSKFANVFAEVNRRNFHYDLTGFYEPMQIGVYTADKKGHYDWHTDASSMDTGAPRKLSMALLLSDSSEFEGGEFQVKASTDEARTLETKRGRAWFFPSYMLHRVKPVTKGTRRSLVIWAGGPAFR